MLQRDQCQDGMCINTAKTETQVLGKGGSKLQIQVYEQRLTQVDKFLYLGGSISTNRTEEDVTRRVGLARGNFQTMNNVWTSNDISEATKLQVYETMILSILLSVAPEAVWQLWRPPN